MLARVTSFAVDGVSARRVEVEADVRPGLPAFTIVGLADTAVREARERVRSALVNSGFEFPQRRITVNLAPADLRKIGPSFDLPLALALLVAAGQLEQSRLDGCAAVGELSLDGGLRPVRGAIAFAGSCAGAGLGRLLLPLERAREAALVPGLDVVGATGLRELVAVLRGEAERAALPCEPAEEQATDSPDLADVRGHAGLVLALEVAAAGGHNLLMHGPPGTGKTMLARRLPSLLPALGDAEALEATRIHSIAGLHATGALLRARPFRAPHHSVSAAGLVGGGVPPMPGEATLAHHGVLFLDELSEFARPALEALRQPLEDGAVTIVRGQRAARFPTRFMLVAATNPCPCGAGGPACHCSAADLMRHRRRLSGPLLDRIDVSLSVQRPNARELREQQCPPSADVRLRVCEARDRQTERSPAAMPATNAHLAPDELKRVAAPTAGARRLLARLHDAHALSARGHDRVLRVARTLADLDGSGPVTEEHVLGAAALRLESRASEGMAA